MAEVKLYLSAATDEFQTYRAALRSDLARPNVTVKIQEDFVAWGTDTLQKLDEYIKQRDAVIHLVGDETGASVATSGLPSILGRYADFAKRFAPIADVFQANNPPLTYTQWEAYLAIYHNKPLIIATPSPQAKGLRKKRTDPSQRAAQEAHLARLANLGRFPEIVFDNSDRLAVMLLRSHLHDILNEWPAPGFVDTHLS